MNFRKFIESFNTKEPEIHGNFITYNLGPNFLLKPGQSFLLNIPESHKNLVIKDIILSHRKGPYGHNEPNMRWEPEKNKWRDYYGAYTTVEIHDVKTNQWHKYVDEFGSSAKFAEHRPGDWEDETLHDLIKIGKIYPDLIRVSNPGNQRASVNPMTKEKVNPMDERSTTEIRFLKVIFFPKDLLDSNIQFYERIYSKSGGPTDELARFADYKDNDKSTPIFGNYGYGIYPNSIPLVSNWGIQNKRIREIDGKWYFVMDKESVDLIKDELSNRIERASGPNNTYFYNNKEYVKVFPLTMNPGPGAKLQGNTLKIDIPPEFYGKKIKVIEAQIGDTEFRPDRIKINKPSKRLGFAHLFMGLNDKSFIPAPGISVAPAMVASGSPEQPITVKPGDKVFIKSEDNTSYLMGWRIGFVE